MRKLILRKISVDVSLLMWVIMLSPQLEAQILSGVIKDQRGRPVLSAHVVINSTQEHTHSNEFGTFKIPGVQLGDTLHTSSLGYGEDELIIQQDDLEHGVQIILSEVDYDLSQINISDHHYSTRQLARFDLKTNPVTSSQEVLTTVPGLIIGQHAGGGKAEQLFLRGFDLDHGTDINITVDGMPINMVSHAHGQGYADLHFIIPEVVDRVNYEKGPYLARVGNQATAGHVSLETMDRLEASSLNLEYGRYNTLRMLGLVDLSQKNGKTDGYLAIENLMTDGPFNSSQDFHRSNLMAKFGHEMENGDRISLLASRFSSRWNASGQVPQRAIDQGLIDRFGAIDDTEGGETSRTNFALTHSKSLGRSAFLKSNAYYINYDFELFSNFTFYLEDPENGDQIRQKENRNIAGFTSTYFDDFYLGSHYTSIQAGAGLRYDQISDVELSHTLNRKTTLESIYRGDVLESNLFGFYEASIDFGRFTLNPGVRIDHFKFDYNDHLQTRYDYQSKTHNVISPKLIMTYSQNKKWQHFLKLGKGFHSNDSRGIIASANAPETGDYKSVPAAYGADLGTIWRLQKRLVITSALWILLSDQEFVYVGDAGIVEASGRSRRLGVDLGARVQLNDHWFVYGDYNYAYARSTDEPSGSDYIPLAPIYTLTGGITYRNDQGLTGGLRFVNVGDRPANEDYSILAEGYFRVDANLQYDFKHLTLGVVIQNLLNTEWNATQFATESRLFNESASVEEIHLTPGIPFAPRLKFSYRF